MSTITRLAAQQAQDLADLDEARCLVARLENERAAAQRTTITRLAAQQAEDLAALDEARCLVARLEKELAAAQAQLRYRLAAHIDLAGDAWRAVALLDPEGR